MLYHVIGTNTVIRSATLILSMVVPTSFAHRCISSVFRLCVEVMPYSSKYLSRTPFCSGVNTTDPEKTRKHVTLSQYSSYIAISRYHWYHCLFLASNRQTKWWTHFLWRSWPYEPAARCAGLGRARHAPSGVTQHPQQFAAQTSRPSTKIYRWVQKKDGKSTSKKLFFDWSWNFPSN